MRPQRLELISSQDILYINRNYCDWALQTFLTITTESIIFDDDMSGISIIYRNGTIRGIRVHSEGSSKFIGELGDREEFFSIHGDEETINRIDVFIPRSYAIKVCRFQNGYIKNLILIYIFRSILHLEENMLLDELIKMVDVILLSLPKASLFMV